MSRIIARALAAGLSLAAALGSAHASTASYSGLDDGAAIDGSWAGSAAAAASFSAAAGPLHTATFEGLPLGYSDAFAAGPGLQVQQTGGDQGPLLSGVSGTPAMQEANLYGFNVTPGGSQWLALSGTGDVQLKFAGSVHAVGFYLTGTQSGFGQVSLSVVDAGGGTQPLAVPLTTNGGVAFFGLTDTQAISSVHITYGGNDVFGLDDVSYSAAVPEPSPALLMLAGLGLVAGVVARRRR